MQIAIGSTLAIPDLAEVLDHVTHTGLCPVTGILLTQETDDLPMFGVDVQPLLPSQGLCEGFGPVGWINEISLAIREHIVPIDLNDLCRHPGVGVAAGGKHARRTGRIVRCLGDRPEVDRDLTVEPPVEAFHARYQYLAAARWQIERRHPRPVGEHRAYRLIFRIHLQHHGCAFQRLVAKFHCDSYRNHFQHAP